MTKITSENVSQFLMSLGFIPKSGEELTYSKCYNKHENYEIKIKIDKINFKNSIIDYGNKIKNDRKTTCNFNQAENFVVLECINKLLKNGYSPDKIILEKKFPLGHEYKGYLDIQILDNDNKSFLMIECKVWGNEYKKERNNMYDNGGLLFTYFNQDKNTQYLSLYTSIFNEGTILFSIFATIGKIGILKIKTTLNQAICSLIPNKDIVLPDYLYLILLSERGNMIKEGRYRTQDNFNQTKLGNWEIPVIEDKTKQKKFIEEINKFERTL